MIRNKYWFPSMNIQIENIVQSCFNCQLATNTPHTEPAKMTKLPQKPWETVELDFCGPFPNGEYAMVLTDQFSRYPEVEFTRSIAIAPIRERLKKIFATHGVPNIVQTDNGPPFNSQEFTHFAAEVGFKHKPVTPYHPKAQGQIESFNKLVNKIAAIAKQEHSNIHEATYDMLQAYRSTPHPGTKTTPYELLMNRRVRTKLDHYPVETSPKETTVRQHDEKYKERAKKEHDRRHRAKKYQLKPGDAVIIKREKKKKGQTPYEPNVYIVTTIKGSMVTAKRVKDEKTKCRDISRFKLLKTLKHPTTDDQPIPPTVTIPPATESQSMEKDQVIDQQALPSEDQNPPEDEQQGRQPREPRRSRRKKISIFDKHLKDYFR